MYSEAFVRFFGGDFEQKTPALLAIKSK